jgi:hypothetical protein
MNMLLNASSNALRLPNSAVQPPARAPLSARSLMVCSSNPCRGSDEPPIGCGALPVGRG